MSVSNRQTKNRWFAGILATSILIVSTFVLLYHFGIVTYGRVAEAAGESVSSAPRRLCRFELGHSLSYAIHSEDNAELDLSPLMKDFLDAKTGVPDRNFDMKVDPKQTISATSNWQLDLQAVKKGDDGTVILAAKISDLCSQVSRESNGQKQKQTIDGDHDVSLLPFLIRLGERCEIQAFARREESDIKTALTQQSMFITLQWRYPPDGREGNFVVEERNQLGRYKAHYGIRQFGEQQAISRRILGFEKIFRNVQGWGNRTAQTVVHGPGLRVWTGEGPWFDRLRLDEKIYSIYASAPISKTERHIKAKRIDSQPGNIRVDPDDEGWIWEDLFGVELDAQNEQRPPPNDAIVNLSLDEALTQYKVMIDDPEATVGQWVSLLADWIRVHPDQIDELIVDLRQGDLPHPYGESALFAAFTAANIPQARAALLGIMTDDSFGGFNQFRAALALSHSRILPIAFVHELAALSRPEQSGRGLGGLTTAVLGTIVQKQRHMNPEASQAAREELFQRLTTSQDPGNLADVLNGIGNAADDEMFDAILPLADDTNPEIRAASITATRLMSPELTAPYFGPWLQNEENSHVREAVVNTFLTQLSHSKKTLPRNVMEISINHFAEERAQTVTRSLVKLLGEATRQGDNQAREALAQRLQAEMERENKNFDLLKQLGQYVGPADLN